MRIKRGKFAHKRRKKLLKQTKGYRWRRKSHYREAKEALFHARRHAYRDRRQRKRDKRRLWQVKINAKARQLGTSYSALMKTLKDNNVALDRKSLAYLAEHKPETFNKLYQNLN
ncbi:MAG: 50S ribosomal protein L20 [Parcubacteria group bacterium SW_4_49_11]|nr:MAG: 50S ribosomal protein L20 [Parcubacteria group bacterium SW_4_49_11]